MLGEQEDAGGTGGCWGNRGMLGDAAATHPRQYVLCGKHYPFPGTGITGGAEGPGTFYASFHFPFCASAGSAPLGSGLFSLHGPPCLGECTFSSQCMPPRIPYIPAGGAIGSVPMLMACTSCCSPATRSRSQQSRHPVWRPSSAAACVHSPSLRSVGGRRGWGGTITGSARRVPKGWIGSEGEATWL